MLALAAAALAGCSTQTQEQFKHAGQRQPVTDAGERMQSLWTGSWLVLMLVGALVWGLIFYACFAFRRRNAEDPLPMQVRYNLPVEAAYIAAPLIVVTFFFFFTVRDTNAVSGTTLSGASTNLRSDHQVGVVGKQWSWDFNYLNEKVFETGTPARRPVLVLPVGESVRFTVDSRDVIHSFWIPAFLYKLDAIPGRHNTFVVTPTRTGTFAGKCAELCGYQHSRMLFEVKVVERAAYETYIAGLKAKGQTGELPASNGPTSQLDTGADGASVSGGSESGR